MAYSLHEIATIIGTVNADRDLLPVFFKFLSDTAEVQYGLLKHLYDFCKVFVYILYYFKLKFFFKFFLFRFVNN